MKCRFQVENFEKETAQAKCNLVLSEPVVPFSLQCGRQREGCSSCPRGTGSSWPLSAFVVIF